MSDERTIWRGTPSQLINFLQFLLWGAVLAALLFIGIATLRSRDTVPPAAALVLALSALVPLAMIVWKWVVVASTQYELTTERLKLRTGVFNKEMDEVELYRVRDFRVEQPFFLRLFSLATLVLQTSDKSNPVVVLRAIRGWEQVREDIRTYVEACRQRKGVRELDVE